MRNFIQRILLERYGTQEKARKLQEMGALAPISHSVTGGEPALAGALTFAANTEAVLNLMAAPGLDSRLPVYSQKKGYNLLPKHVFRNMLIPAHVGGYATDFAMRGNTDRRIRDGIGAGTGLGLETSHAFHGCYLPLQGLPDPLQMQKGSAYSRMENACGSPKFRYVPLSGRKAGDARSLLEKTSQVYRTQNVAASGWMDRGARFSTRRSTLPRTDLRMREIRRESAQKQRIVSVAGGTEGWLQAEKAFPELQVKEVRDPAPSGPKSGGIAQFTVPPVAPPASAGVHFSRFLAPSFRRAFVEQADVSRQGEVEKKRRIAEGGPEGGQKLTAKDFLEISRKNEEKARQEAMEKPPENKQKRGNAPRAKRKAERP